MEVQQPSVKAEVHEPVKTVVLELVADDIQAPATEESIEEDEDHPITSGHEVNLKDELAELENGDNSYVADEHQHNDDAG